MIAQIINLVVCAIIIIFGVYGLIFEESQGGSLLVIGSAAGVAVMGILRINFIWYLKNISFLALIGYLSGAVTFILMQ